MATKTAAAPPIRAKAAPPKTPAPKPSPVKQGAGMGRSGRNGAAGAAAVKPSSLLPGPVPTGKAARSIGRENLCRWIGSQTDLSAKQVAAVFESLTEVIGHQLSKRGPGMFAIHGLLKLKVVRKPAVKAKQGINPFTKETMMYKAKPARNAVKALPLKLLKEMV